MTMDLPRKIREARRAAGLSQQELSKELGISDKAISAYEVGRSSPPLKVLQKLSAATERPMYWFVADDSPEVSRAMLLEKHDAIEEELGLLRACIRDQASDEAHLFSPLSRAWISVEYLLLSIQMKKRRRQKDRLEIDVAVLKDRVEAVEKMQLYYISSSAEYMSNVNGSKFYFGRRVGE